MGICVSIDYLTRPAEVLREVGRVEKVMQMPPQMAKSIRPAAVLQPYCNRAGTGAYAVDKLSA